MAISSGEDALKIGLLLSAISIYTLLQIANASANSKNSPLPCFISELNNYLNL